MAGASTRAAAAALLLLAEFGRVSLREACVLVTEGISARGRTEDLYYL